MSHKNRRRTPAERAAAIARLKHEEQIPIAALVGETVTLGGKVRMPSYDALHRWGSEGFRGKYLDVLRVRRTGELVTSRAAIERFVTAIADLTAASRLVNLHDGRGNRLADPAPTTTTQGVQT